MSNRQIAKAFRLASQLMELHSENPFKIRSLQNAAFKIDKLNAPLSSMDAVEMASIEGIGKGLQSKISDYLNRQSFSDLDELVSRTPHGVIDMLGIKGIGPKKVLQLWKEMEIESVGELLYACNENRLVTLKGFGEKTQKLIRDSIEFRISNSKNCLYPIAEFVSEEITKEYKTVFPNAEILISGQTRRKCEIITSIEFVTDSSENEFQKYISGSELFKEQQPAFSDENKNGISIRKATLIFQETIPVVFYLCSEELIQNILFITTASGSHLEKLETGYQIDLTTTFYSEEEIYESAGLPYFIPELREGLIEFDLLNKNDFDDLIEETDLKGILHNHSTYSDGNDTLKDMAVYCKELGYEYLGICDHSKSAFYANGLSEEKIILQHAEIDKLNKTLAPFRILKGIESDILSSGELDYSEDVLKSFDFIVASIHSNLRMEEPKATARLIKAIENPYTTILGHPTGRLLLSRPGYPIDHKKIIDACAANNVVIELNANPYRLDIDWRWIQYALEKNVMISINPDAHRKEGYHDMHFGVGVARKGGLTRAMTFNALSLEEVLEKF
ncbi:MAG: DNA polymerase/3'-5' exonuclease PolX [Bacteroidetes bacterium]|nr:DNA polymerase/3'-5' exonuclease PolX [Bacteroidota bacterium]MBK9414651.1 DNA polymerase/3'-5' exonuclease PolX [Bacteroidota bacterium]MBP6427070.1 DNA polymerase/3'-5' exonuclease PolX [Bacteroidia bacterium]MBP6657031.1 DNA polymerase/3'-5' exonuclease PolX [Bacteroidia bacterium]